MKATGKVFLGLGILSAAVAVVSLWRGRQVRYAFLNDPVTYMYEEEDPASLRSRAASVTLLTWLKKKGAL